MKKIISLLLVLLILMSMLVLPSCKKGKENTDDEATTAPISNGDEEINFAQRDYGGYDYKVLCTTQCEEFYVTPEETGSVIQSKVLERNVAVQDKYNVVLDFTALEGRSGGRDAFTAEIRNSLAAGSECYDLVIGQTYYTMALALEGAYYNMAESLYLNLDKPWYDKAMINDNVEIAGKLYAISGSYVISQTSTLMGLYYNKSLYSKNKLDKILGNKDIYTTVKDGEWTYEKFNQMVSSVYSDVNSNSEADSNDIFGLVKNTHAPRCALTGANTPMVVRSGSGEFSLADYYNDRLINVFNTYFDFFNKNLSVHTIGDDSALIDFFSNGQALFCCNAIEFLAKGSLGDSGVDYGIVPFPKYDAQQENYYTSTIRWEVAHIPSVCDTERAEIVFEYLNYETSMTLLPAYFETVLQDQKSQTLEDAEMLQLLRDTVYYDFATFYQTQIGRDFSDNIFLGAAQLIHKGDSGLSSWWASNEGLYTETFDELIETYKYFLK